MPVEGTSMRAIERASFSATHRSHDRGRERRHAVAPAHTRRLRVAAVIPDVPQPRESGEAGQRNAHARRENVLRNDRAVRVVAGRAVDAGDCRTLLEMLGLDAVGADDRRT
jgi:hypothetical protein